jgi:hypothetical protein
MPVRPTPPVYSGTVVTWPVHRVTRFRIVEPYRLEVVFSDGTEQQIDMEPVMVGRSFEGLRDVQAFGRVAIDDLTGTLKWANGLTIDADKLYAWPTEGPALAATVRKLAVSDHRFFFFEKWMAVATALLFAFNLATWAGLTGYDAFRPETSVWMSGALFGMSLGALVQRRSTWWGWVLLVGAIVALGFGIAAMSAGR